jgi:hypothetical protein
MPRITAAERTALMRQTQKDESLKNRGAYDYASDVLAEQCAMPGSIWVEPNDTVKLLAEDAIDGNGIPFDPDNEVQKGMFWTEQAEFVARHAGEVILCEALGYKPCLLHDCSQFVAAQSKGHDRPVCREYMFVFEQE